MSDFNAENKVLTLSELTAGISQVISRNFANSFWVKAELAKLNHYPESGHCYPSLVEKEKGAIRAEMRGTIWANDFLRINQKFLQVTREPLKEGIHILFRAMVKYHPVYGLSLQISDIDPTYTLGEMAREKLETINRLKKDGEFDLNKQISLPSLPQRIAIISVKTSKGFSDFMSILRNNQWGYAFSCYLFPALLQGDKAVDSILGQLQFIRTMKDHFDVAVIIRGGGGDVGLNCYDNYSLAREVARFPLPVLTGIGHSTNETVVEMVSGRNLITPTDVAYFLLQMYHNFSVKLQELADTVTDFALQILAEEKRKQRDMGKGLVESSTNLIANEKMKQEEIGRRLTTNVGFMMKDGRYRIGHHANLLGLFVHQFITKQGMRIIQAEQQVKLLDPINVLKRGYSITYAGGKALRDTAGLNIGEEITTQLYEGTIKSEIRSKSK